MTVNESTEHRSLIDELAHLESLSPEERLNHAREKRKEQLNSYKHCETMQGPNPEKVDHCSHSHRIKFDKNIEIIEAAARNDSTEVKRFLKEGYSPDLQNEDGLSALHQAVIEDCVDVVAVLVHNKANLNIKDADLWTPLHAAVACGNYELCKYLVDNNASMVEINTDGNMPIDLVEDNETIEIFLDEKMSEAGYSGEDLEKIRNVIAEEMLVDLQDSVANGRDLNVVGEHGETAMHVAAANGYEDVVEFLLDHGAKINLGDNDNWQPIHAAACWGQEKIIELLVNHGADLEAKTSDGETPIDLTEDEELQGMIEDLKSSGRIVRELKRSQSNSSRTLSVRRTSIVDKHQLSVNDAKQEGIFRQNPEFLHVVIKTDEDSEHEDPAVTTTTTTETPQKQPSPLAVETPEEKVETNSTAKPDQVVLNIDDDESTVAYSAEKKDKFKDENSEPVGKDHDLEGGNGSSYNTAAKHHKRSPSDSPVKKKCCVIL